MKTAFLYGDVPEDQYIYMRRPAGLTDADMHVGMRVRKCICGLPHAPATFRKQSDALLRSLGFTPTVSDPRLYVKINSDGTKVYVVVLVDDFGIAANNKTVLAKTKSQAKGIYMRLSGDCAQSGAVS